VIYNITEDNFNELFGKVCSFDVLKSSEICVYYKLITHHNYQLIKGLNDCANNEDPRLFKYEIVCIVAMTLCAILGTLYWKARRSLQYQRKLREVVPYRPT
jgi:hypothetical protein